MQKVNCGPSNDRVSGSVALVPILRSLDYEYPRVSYHGYSRVNYYEYLRIDYYNGLRIDYDDSLRISSLAATPCRYAVRGQPRFRLPANLRRDCAELLPAVEQELPAGQRCNPSGLRCASIGGRIGATCVVSRSTGGSVRWLSHT